MQSLDFLVRSIAIARLDARVVRVEKLPGALGRRTFARVWLESNTDSGLPRTLIARIEAPEDAKRRPAGSPQEPSLEPIRALLEERGLPVPRRFAADENAGVELLGDLGEHSLAVAAAASSVTERDALYTEACNLVPRLQKITAVSGVEAFSRRLDAAQIDYKAQRFANWSLRDAGESAITIVRDAFAMICSEILAAPQRLAHRDFQSANLYVIDPRDPAFGEGARPSLARDSRIAMIDLQGAFMAPPEYDLVCLLRDSYVELPESSIAAHIAEVRPLLPDAPDLETFSHRFDLLTLTRKGKDHALYLYAAAELGDRRYLKYLPIAQRALLGASARVAKRDPRFAPLAELIATLGDPAETPCAP